MSRTRVARIVFWPVYFFIEKVRFARSLLLLLLLLPDGYVAFLLVRQTTASVEFSAKESRGIEYITPARGFLAVLQRMRVVGQVGIDEATRAELAALTVQADGLARQVDAMEALHGGQLQTTEAWKRIRDDWALLKATPHADAAERDAAYAKLTAFVAGELIVNKAGNYSNLILDPDLDSYWMMDAYVFKLPTLGELSATAGTAGMAAIADGAVSTEERLGLAATAGLIDSTTSDLINVDLRTALEDNEIYSEAEGRLGNKRLRGQLADRFKAAADALHAYTALLHEQVLLPDKPSATAPELAKRAAAAVASVQDLQEAVGPELKLLCDERADRYRDTRLVGILVFIGAALLISYVFNGFTSSVRASQSLIEEENRHIQADILGLLTVVSNAADGDLTSRAKVTQGTLGNVADAFNQMMETWQALMGSIIQQLDRTNQAVAKLRFAADAMAKGSSRQSAEVVAAASSVQRMSEEITRVSGNAENAAAAAKRTQESAQQGSKSVQTVVAGMDTLRSLVQSGAKKVKTLGDRSMEITSIVGTIAKISEQTNMLALNAAIEAARAGEQGRGFSVVADEVRKLAERTAIATQEIDKLVRSIQAETNESVQAIERQTQVVEDEGRAVSDAGTALVRIQDVSSQSSNLVTDIASIARDQMVGAHRVVQTMERISAIAKETETGAQGSLAIAQGLGELSEELRGSIGRFKVD
jgi:methyl-accepting chemotaxis protein